MGDTSKYKEELQIALGSLAHVDAGKTTLSESMLHKGGIVDNIGRVDKKNAFLDNYELEKERGIIDQEIGMNEDAPDSVVFDNLMAAMYAVHPIRQPILGTGRTIREITPEVLYTCHRARYAPCNMLLCGVCDVDPESVASAAREVLGSER